MHLARSDAKLHDGTARDRDCDRGLPAARAGHSAHRRLVSGGATACQQVPDPSVYLHTRLLLSSLASPPSYSLTRTLRDRSCASCSTHSATLVDALLPELTENSQGASVRNAWYAVGLTEQVAREGYHPVTRLHPLPPDQHPAPRPPRRSQSGPRNPLRRASGGSRSSCTATRTTKSSLCVTSARTARRRSRWARCAHAPHAPQP